MAYRRVAGMGCHNLSKRVSHMRNEKFSNPGLEGAE